VLIQGWIILILIGTVAAFAEERSVESLISDLGDAAFFTREQATAVLRERGEDARTALEKAAQSRDPETRERACELLAELDRKAAIEADPTVRRKRVVEGMKELRELWKQKEWKTLAERGQILAGRIKEEARFVYLEAEALEQLGKTDEAAAARKKALALNPNEEAPHYIAGEMLSELERDDVAAGEWRRILEIPPKGDVYDVNALFRLGQIEVRAKHFTEAADWLEKGLVAYRKAREQGGHGMSIAGAKESQIEKQIVKLRRQATEDNQDIRVHIETTVKDGNHDELRRELAKVTATVTVNVQPRELRIFDLKQVTLHYDADKQTLVPLLNSTACCKPTSMPLKSDTGRVAIRSLDCYYLYEVNATGGDAKQLARYELDYTVYVTPGKRLLNWSNLTVTINGKKYDWEKLQQGEPFDWLPEQFEIEVNGTGSDGKPQRVTLKMLLHEPAMKPTP
jgi:tetratricopeptide (TPR) repeat protein